MAFETMAADGVSAYTIRPLEVAGAQAFYIQNATRSWIVVFTASTTDTALSGTIAIDARAVAPAFEPTILIADLTPGTSYALSRTSDHQYTLTPGSGTPVDASGLFVASPIR
jgi:hypothetical protein